MRLALIRRGHSATGGAEAYLKRFAGALAAAGHVPVLYTSPDWPASEWPFEMHRVSAGKSPAAFASAVAALEPRRTCDLVFSLERLWGCDCYRAGDGVHAAWLARRAKDEPFWKPLFRRFQPKHRQIVALEMAMFREQKARAVIVNSRMVAREIVDQDGYPAERIHLVYNGVPPALGEAEQQLVRTAFRRELGLGDTDYVLLFAGSGWERKGLAEAIAAVERSASKPVLLVAGSGSRRGLPALERVRYLGPVAGLSRTLAAADAFILPTKYDPFSNACLEALAAGRPVITTQANGFAEIIAAEEGIAVADAREVPALATAIDRWSDAHARETAYPRLRAKGAEFSVERNLAETLRVLRSLAPGER